MSIYNLIKRLSSIQNCCIDSSCVKDFSGLFYYFTDINQVDYTPIILEDDLVSSCFDCTLFPISEFNKDYLHLFVLPSVINECKRHGFYLVEEEWLPGANHYTVIKVAQRDTVKHEGKKIRRNFFSMITFLPTKNVAAYPHFR